MHKQRSMLYKTEYIKKSPTGVFLVGSFCVNNYISTIMKLCKKNIMIYNKRRNKRGHIMETQIVLSNQIEAMPISEGVSANKLINPTLAFAVPTTPNNLSFSVTVLTKDMSFEEETVVSFKVLDSEDNIINQIQAPLPVEQVRANRNPLNTFNFNLDFRNVLFRKAGDYFISFELNGNEVERQKFEIIVNSEI